MWWFFWGEQRGAGMLWCCVGVLCGAGVLGWGVRLVFLSSVGLVLCGAVLGCCAGFVCWDGAALGWCAMQGYIPTPGLKTGNLP